MYTLEHGFVIGLDFQFTEIRNGCRTALLKNEGDSETHGACLPRTDAQSRLYTLTPLQAKKKNPCRYILRTAGKTILNRRR